MSCAEHYSLPCVSQPFSASLTRRSPRNHRRRIRPFPHNTNPNDWRPTIDRLTPDHSPDIQIGCDVYLVGAGQPYFQFKESGAYEAWLNAAAVAQAVSGKQEK